MAPESVPRLATPAVRSQREGDVAPALVRRSEHEQHAHLGTARRHAGRAEERAVGPLGVVRAVQLVTAVEEILVRIVVQEVEDVEPDVEPVPPPN